MPMLQELVLATSEDDRQGTLSKASASSSGTRHHVGCEPLRWLSSLDKAVGEATFKLRDGCLTTCISRTACLSIVRVSAGPGSVLEPAVCHANPKLGTM